MRSKTPLALMEQLVMVLVFALSAAFCLRIFVMSDRISKENEAVSHAVLLAQNTAELLKSSGQDWELVLEEQRWKKTDGRWQQEYAESQQEYDADQMQEKETGCRVEIAEEITGIDGLCRVKISVVNKEKTGEERILFQIPVAWQEVTAHE